MPAIIRRYNNENQPIVTSDHSLVSLTYFNLLNLEQGQTYSNCLQNIESVYVVLSGNCDVIAEGERYSEVGKRKDIWSGKADSVYVPCGTRVEVRANLDNTQLAIVGGYCETAYQPFRITPEEVSMVEVGSSATKSHRRIYHILGQNAQGRAGNLIVNELYAEEGCWSGYPPHKHDTENRVDSSHFEETSFEEVYYFRFKPETGFGVQIVYESDFSSQVYMTRDGDTVIIDKGYHPTVTSPGHEEYILAILVGKYQRSLVQNFQTTHRHLMSMFPGISEMQEKYK